MSDTEDFATHEMEYARVCLNRSIGRRDTSRGSPEHVRDWLKYSGQSLEKFKEDAEWYLFEGMGICG